jgi:murein L,D-transpeptidase YcbB/YkuD
VIVGDEDTPTPIFDDRMRYVEVNPSWYVPRSIVKEVLEKESKEPGYMSKAGFVWRASGEEGRRRA